MINIDHASDERIAEFTKLKDSSLHKKGLSLLESEKIFFKLIHQKIPIEKILCTHEFAERHHLSHPHLYVCEKSILSSIAGFKVEFEVLALFQTPTNENISSLDDKIIILNGLTSPENVGSIIRSAAAFNINSLIVDKKTCSPYLRRSIRVSMGNIFSMKVHASNSLEKTLIELKELGYKIISTANIDQSMNLSHFQFPKKMAIIIGSEGHGIDSSILELSDQVLKIEINSHVAHLNASNAASIFFFEMAKLTNI